MLQTCTLPQLLKKEVYATLFVTSICLYYKKKICSTLFCNSPAKANVPLFVQQALTLIRIQKKTRVFEYAGSARTPKAYWYDVKAMHPRPKCSVLAGQRSVHCRYTATQTGYLQCTLPTQYTIHCRLQGTLHLHCSDLVTFDRMNTFVDCSYTARTLQSMQCSCSLHCTVHAAYVQCTLLVHCSYTVCTLHFSLGSLSMVLLPQMQIHNIVPIESGGSGLFNGV